MADTQCNVRSTSGGVSLGESRSICLKSKNQIACQIDGYPELSVLAEFSGEVVSVSYYKVLLGGCPIVVIVILYSKYYV